MLHDNSVFSFFAGAVLGAVIVAGIARYQWCAEGQRERERTAGTGIDDVKGVNLEDEVIKEHLSRNLLFLGPEGCRATAQSHVAVVGLGGVGSHAGKYLPVRYMHIQVVVQHLLKQGVVLCSAYALAGRRIEADINGLRSGVNATTVPIQSTSLVSSSFRHNLYAPLHGLQVTLSSLNRHAVATRADLGLPKATVLAKHFHEIFPEVQVDSLVEMYTAETEDRIFGGEQPPDYVLDAIDNLDTKVRTPRQ
jgi:tRNA threonylcarbamoyladenosine dehydratase